MPRFLHDVAGESDFLRMGGSRTSSSRPPVLSKGGYQDRTSTIGWSQPRFQKKVETDAATVDVTSNAPKWRAIFLGSQRASLLVSSKLSGGTGGVEREVTRDCNGVEGGSVTRGQEADVFFTYLPT